MPTLFTRIIDGEIPGRFVWKDDRCVAFLTIEPMRPGHTLVVPRDEIAHWIELSQAERTRIMAQLPARLAAMSGANAASASA